MSNTTQHQQVIESQIENPGMAPWAAEAGMNLELEADSDAGPGAGAVFGTALKLFFVSIGAFFKGCLLAGFLNLIPILPTVSRSTGSLMARSFAIVLFLPFAALVVAAFPLLLIKGYRTEAQRLMADSLAWYDKKDLVPV